MPNKDEKINASDSELLRQQLELLAEQSKTASADDLVKLTEAMATVYRVLNPWC